MDNTELKESNGIQKSFIEKILQINKIFEFLNINNNNLYIFNSLGIRDFGIKDDIETKLQNLKLQYKFNVNETLIIRSFDSKIIMLYIIMDNKFYIIKANDIIINIKILIDNYMILFFKNNYIEIINYKNFNSVIFIKETNDLDALFKLSIAIIDEEKKYFINKQKVLYNVKPMELLTLKNNIGINTQQTIENENEEFICERVWSTFVIQKEPCICYSIIENNKRLFKYIIHIDNKKIIFNNIFDFIKFLLNNFFKPLKLCTFLTTE